jgi:hypothetical protein
MIELKFFIGVYPRSSAVNSLPGLAADVSVGDS